MKENNIDKNEKMFEVLKRIINEKLVEGETETSQRILDAKHKGIEEGLHISKYLDFKNRGTEKFIPFSYWLEKCVFEYSWNINSIKQDMLEKGYLIKENGGYTCPKESKYFCKGEKDIYISLDLSMKYEYSYIKNRMKIKNLKDFYTSDSEEKERENIYKISTQRAKEKSNLLQDVRDRKKLK